jgi:O-antigen/teichoic acid export membrane protein
VAGVAGLQKLTVKTIAVTIAMVSILCLGLVLAGAQLLAILYNDRIPGEQTIVSILSLNLVLYALSMSLENGLVALNRPASIFRANVIGLVVTFVSGGVLILAQGVVGAAIASVIGNCAATATKGVQFLTLCRHGAPQEVG